MQLESFDLLSLNITFISISDEWIQLPGEKDYSLLTYNDILPENVHLMSIERWNNPVEPTMEVLLRFENLFEANEMDIQTSEISIPEDFFKSYKIASLEEMSLGGDRPIDNVKNKFKWTPNSQLENMFEPLKVNYYYGVKNFDFKLDPMAIRTFKATLTL